MNKFITKIVGAALGLTLAIGVGVAVGVNNVKAREVDAAFSTTMATSITSGSKYAIGYTRNTQVNVIKPFASNSMANIAQTAITLATATQDNAWTITSATVGNQSGYSISTVVDETTYYLYSGGTGSKKIKTVTDMVANSLWDITYSNGSWKVKSIGANTYLEVFNNADFRTYANVDQANSDLELYLWNNAQSNDTITALTPVNASLNLNAGTVITKDVIGTVAASGTQATDNYLNYNVDVGTYVNSTYTRLASVTLGTTYVSYNTSWNALRLTATDYPTTPGGSTYASVVIPFTVNNIASLSFKIALSSAPSTQVTSRTILEGATETLTIFGYTSGTNPGVDWSVSPSGVVTVSESGLVTAVSAGTATVTATSKQNNANGVKTTASVAYTINAGPAWAVYFNSDTTGFGDITAASIEGSETKYYTASQNGLEWTLKTVSGEGANVRVTQPDSSSKPYLQIGTTDNPAVEFSLRSNVFGSAKPKITSVTLRVQGAAQASAATIAVTADDGTFTCGGNPTTTMSGQSAVDKVFTSSAAYGHINLNFTSVTKGIRILSIIVSAEADNTNKGKAYAFASKVEPVDSCDNTGKAALISEYNGLTSEVKSLADAITLYDRPQRSDDDYGETYKTKSVTLATKMTYIVAKYSGGNGINIGSINNEKGTNASATIIIIAVSSITLVAVSGYFVIRRRREN